jgi:hypothetical protein
MIAAATFMTSAVTTPCSEALVMQGGHMRQLILAKGPPDLTREAADAALDAIDFIAAAVRGYDAIEVTHAVRSLWRTHLANWYPSLPLVTRTWYATAPLRLATIEAQWQMLDPMQRGLLLQQWSMDLPHMLMMLDPVLEQAQDMETQDNVRAQIAAVRQQASQREQTSADYDWQVRSLQAHSNRMTDLTTGLIRAMSRG